VIFTLLYRVIAHWLIDLTLPQAKTFPHGKLCVIKLPHGTNTYSQFTGTKFDSSSDPARSQPVLYQPLQGVLS
jgi:hypothetical protein